jgi:methionyl aminopeptidase
MMIRLKSVKDIMGLRASGRILAETLKLLAGVAQEGMRLEELDRLARAELKKHKAEATFLGYRPEGAARGFPAAICTSVNERVVHGLPNAYKLRNGDVLKIDLGVTYRGYITDSAWTVAVGKVPPRTKKLLAATERALEAGIGAVKPGGYLGDIGHAVERTVRRAGYKVIRGLTGHGVGFSLHEEPTVLNYGEKKTGLRLEPGLVIAIEPMVSEGSDRVLQLEDESYATEDGAVSAHFEHTVAVTREGCEVLTEKL